MSTIHSRGHRPGYLAYFLSVVLLTSLPVLSQATHTQNSQPSKDKSSEPVATFQATTRMVTLQLVAKDSQGRHLTGLTAADFQVFEQSPSRGKQRYGQKIAAFREVRMADVVSQKRTAWQIPEGTHTNLVTLQKDPVPPTILLVDGLNTEPQSQAQVHVQMLKMLRALPKDVPVAVFLLGYRLRLVQDLTSDPGMLQAALEQLPVTSAGAGIATIDPRDDPNELSAQLEATAHVEVELIDAAKQFEQSVYTANMDRRVYETIDALMSIARNLGGYPGRKNLLWISTAFPIYLRPLDPGRPGREDAGLRNYWVQLRRLATTLSDSKVAVYPINPAGVETPRLFNVGTRPRDLSPQGFSDSLIRETDLLTNKQDTMQVIADGTGGRICTGDNDLCDCVRRAVDDSSEFYEIAYYPDSQNWNGEYRTILVRTKQPDLHLAYRQGYFAKAEAGETPKEQKAELQAACRDYLDATSISIVAREAPEASPERLAFNLTIGLPALTLMPTSSGGHNLNVALAICTFDKNGIPDQLLEYPMSRELSAQEYEALEATGVVSENIFVPGPKPVAVRLLVRDIPSGRLGSLRVRVGASAPIPAVPATGKGG